jgi:hypothetical protein
MNTVDELLDVLAAAELTLLKRYAHVAPRILDVPDLPPPVTTALRIRLSVSRAVRGEMPGDWHDERLSRVRRQADEAMGRALQITKRLDALLAERNRLRDLLDVYRAYARDKAFERDGRPLEGGEPAELYDKASDLLYRGPVDLDRAERYVRRYVEAVRRRFPEETS